MRERPVPCCICRRDTFHDDAVCGRGACVELLAHAERRIADRLAARAADHARDGAALPSLGAAPFLAAVASTHGNASRDRGTPSTGPALASSTDVKQRGQSMTYRGQEG